METPRTWAQQQYHCNSIGGHLASIPNEETNDFFLSLIKESTFMGGRKVSLQWTWTDETSFTYTNWASGEASGDGLVMELLKGVQWAPDGTWNDVPESEVKHALCQKDDGVLEAGWETARSFNGVLYLLLDTRSTWTQQNTECGNLGGD